MYLTINAQGGLANRMRSIASAVSLTKDINRQLRIIWQPTAEMAAHFSDLFENSELLPNVESMSNICYNLTFEFPRKRNFYISSLYQFACYAKCLSDANGSLIPWIDNPKGLRERIKGITGKVLITSGLEFYNSNPANYNRLFIPKKEIIDIITTVSQNLLISDVSI